MMLAVAVAAVVLGAGMEATRLGRLRAGYLREAFMSDESNSYLGKELGFASEYMDRREVEVVRRWFRELNRTYKRAASNPWRKLDPSPRRPPEVLRYFQVIRDHPHIQTQRNERHQSPALMS